VSPGPFTFSLIICSLVRDQVEGTPREAHAAGQEHRGLGEEHVS